MLLETNVHKHKHQSQGQLLSNRGTQVQIHNRAIDVDHTKRQKKKSVKELPHAIILNDNAIDYIHWDDPNELVDHLRLLLASSGQQQRAHNKIRKAGLIIN